jgi:hypothetical protein
MRDFAKKLGSLVLGVGALGLVLANAAMTHGCASSPPTQVPPNAAPPNAAAESPKSNPCDPPSYMYATKAPIWVPPECHGGKPAPQPGPQQAPASNAQVQAP